MPFVVTWMDFEGTMLREISQMEKDKYSMISLIHGILNKEITKPNQNKQIDTENRVVVTRGEGAWGEAGRAK